MHALRDAAIDGKRVLYRPDYNVPLKDGVIQDDFRITATFPTIDFLLERQCKVIIATHLGRPEGQRLPQYDLRPVAERLAAQYHDRRVYYVQDVFAPQTEEGINRMRPGEIMLLPNLRYYAEEEGNGIGFARSLARLADIYVNDAFACDHREHASIVGVPSLLPGYPGFLLEAEMNHLGPLLGEPPRPFIVIMGGAKVSDKIEVIRSLGKRADQILIGGAMANTFLLAKDEPIGDSLVEREKVHLAESLIHDLGEKLVLPIDYVRDGEGEVFRYMDLGAATVALFTEKLAGAKTVFWNGSLGYAEDPRFAVATEAIAKVIGGMEGVTSVVAGGDTVETITKLNLHEKFTFVSTGGGAALEFLSGREMPGVRVLG